MPCAKLKRFEGVVADVIDGARLAVRLPDGTALTARFSRRLALLQKSYAVGDQVQIGLFAHRRGGGLVLNRDLHGTLARASLTAPGRPAN